jgi:hypothetical protein
MKSFREHLITESKSFSEDDVKKLGDSLSVDWKKISLKQFQIGLNVESEHDDGSELDVVNSKTDLAKIVLAHLKEKPDYYTRLKKVEEDAPTNSVGSGSKVGLKDPIISKKPILIKRKRLNSI